jgi:hypothetical protein
MDSLQSVLPRALIELFRSGPMSQGKLDAAWGVAVGDAITRVATPSLRADGSVEVRTTDQRWQREMSRSSGMILSKLNALLGPNAIAKLHVK